MERVKAKIAATASVELVVIIKKYNNGQIELDEVLEILDLENIDDIEVKAEF